MKQVGRVVSFMENDNKNLAYFQHIKKSIKKFPMLKFSRWTPTLGVFLKWDSQKVLKMAHFVIFRHIGGVRGVQKKIGINV